MKNDVSTLRNLLLQVNPQSCPNDINFHCHTIYSDGSMRPEELIHQACLNNVRNIAVTDHHSIHSFPLITNWLFQHNSIYNSINFWSGIEISCLLKGCLVHVLGLGFDPTSSYLKPYTTGDAPQGVHLHASNVISSIRNASGLSILAHPARYRLNYKELILEAHSLGIDGVETWYDYDMSAQWKPTMYLCSSIDKLVKSLDLLSSCGTDSHGYSLFSR
ncbi:MULTISPECIES: PHP domain-containing protein [Prochlorococcus]|uniref:PHP domain-containing protein n=1 Tax=Prochlorococcus TaxID=1218 RepID=UPI0005339B10|nr:MULTISPECIES: PHP domain-containing protein [Prochlorococcus]KGG12460.1 PHP family metal-dependent phosphoesterase [Prochlorococcus sp. MIT 0601]